MIACSSRTCFAYVAVEVVHSPGAGVGDSSTISTNNTSHDSAESRSNQRVLRQVVGASARAEQIRDIEVMFCSALDHIHRQSAARCLLVLVLHVAAGVAHGLDDFVQ